MLLISLTSTLRREKCYLYIQHEYATQDTIGKEGNTVTMKEGVPSGTRTTHVLEQVTNSKCMVNRFLELLSQLR